MANAIEIRGLCKEYGRDGRIRAVDDLSLDVPEGGVYGFLGANGSGKTTTIRALLGLLTATSGTMRVLGAEAPKALHSIADDVGALVEAPSFFPNFSGRRNLDLLARSRGFPTSRVSEVLETVGLADRAKSRFATYSLGMRQRLGVAAVLLKDPRLLILDEPANGLDPPGILEMRTLVKRLGVEGRTVFVSSHILSEIQLTCDRLAIIAHGRNVTSGTVHEVLAMGTSSRYRVVLPDARTAHPLAADALRNDGFTVRVDHDGLVVDAEPEFAPRITYALAQRGLYLAELSPIERSLEDAFLELTGSRPEGEARPG